MYICTYVETTGDCQQTVVWRFQDVCRNPLETRDQVFPIPHVSHTVSVELRRRRRTEAYVMSEKLCSLLLVYNYVCYILARRLNSTHHHSHHP
jgi:hypothetical protein